MSKAEKFIQEYTRNCSNYTGVINKKTYEGYYVPWLTPDQARKAVEIARKEAKTKAIDVLRVVMNKYETSQQNINVIVNDFEKND